MNYIDSIRRPQRYVPAVLAVLAINGFLLWGFLQLHVYTPAKSDNLIRVTIVAPGKASSPFLKKRTKKLLFP